MERDGFSAGAGRELVVRRYSWDVIGEKLDRAYALYARRAMAAGMAQG